MKVRIEFDDSLDQVEVIIRASQLGPEIEQIQQVLGRLNRPSLVFYKGTSEFFLKLEDLLFFETDGNKMIGHTRDDAYEVKMKLYELEEAPSIAIGQTMRDRIGQAAVRAAQSVGYENAGTIEFLLDEAKGEFYFMEMNTRVQVEHPVTEFVTGVDIVKEQIKIAAGQELSVRQEDVQITGHAIECRINAENPAFNFAPSPGKISNLYLPSGGVGLRVDSAVYPGYTIPPYYDSMIAKVIVHGENRFEALMKMQRALYELEIEGVVTNTDFQLDLISDKRVVAGDYDTAYLMEEFLPHYQEELKK